MRNVGMLYCYTTVNKFTVLDTGDASEVITIVAGETLDRDGESRSLLRVPLLRFVLTDFAVCDAAGQLALGDTACAEGLPSVRRGVAC